MTATLLMFVRIFGQVVVSCIRHTCECDCRSQGEMRGLCTHWPRTIRVTAASAVVIICDNLYLRFTDSSSVVLVRKEAAGGASVWYAGVRQMADGVW